MCLHVFSLWSRDVDNLLYICLHVCFIKLFLIVCFGVYIVIGSLLLLFSSTTKATVIS